MSAPKVSVIIPVYNAGQYLVNLLDNLIHQTLKEIEIIIILDCPTDGSDHIAESFAAKDQRIKLIYNPKNLHVGLSRNEGLKIAQGEYIAFCDHDDDVPRDMYEQLYIKGKEKNAEVVLSDYYIINGKEKWFLGFPPEISEQEFIHKSLSELINFHAAQKNCFSLRSCGPIWNQLFQRDFLQKHHITFPDNKVITFEDRIFLLQIYSCLQHLVRIPVAYYKHIWHNNNTGGSYQYKSLSLITTYLTYLYVFLKKKDILKQEINNYTDAVVFLTYASFRHELRHRTFLQSIKKLSLIRKNEILQSAIKQSFKRVKHYPLTKIIFLCLIYNPMKKHIKQKIH